MSRTIKWTSELEAHLKRSTELKFDPERIRTAIYRPYFRQWTYYDAVITHRLYQQDQIFPVADTWDNKAIVYTQPGSQKDFMVLAVGELPDLHLVGAAAGAECLPRFRIQDGGRLDNITDWALKQFTQHYKAGPGKRLEAPTKEGIFHYVYAVLHDPVYREKYALNLKREFPRIPLHGGTRADFWRWAGWGEQLMKLHIGYEAVESYRLTRVDTPDTKARTHQGDDYAPKPLLRSDPETGRILIDSETTLTGVPPEAWTYRLGNRSAIDWVLDQHKEKKPKDLTIREKFDTYRLKDHKERVIELLGRVVAVSVETVRIVTAIEEDPR